VSRNQVGARTVIAGTFAVDFLPNRCPAIRAVAVADKAGFVYVHDVAATAFFDDMA